MRTLVLTIIALALIIITFAIRTGWTAPEVDNCLAGPPMVRQAAAAASLMDQHGPKTRPLALAALNSPLLRFALSESFDDTPPVENPAPVFVPLISMHQAVLGDGPFSVYRRGGGLRTGLLRPATISDDIIIFVRLADGTEQIVSNDDAYRRLIGAYRVALAVAVLIIALIGLMTWASLSYARPLEQLARASRSFVKIANAAARQPLPEIGPRPVRELASALNLAGPRIVRAMTEQTTALAAIAHDLRTYLNRLRMRNEFTEDPAW